MGNTHKSRDFANPDLHMRKQSADQLRGNREADQRLCFRYLDSSIPFLSKSEISSLWPSSVGLQPCLCRTWSETPKNGFLTTVCRLHVLYKTDNKAYPFASVLMKGKEMCYSWLMISKQSTLFHKSTLIVI